MQLRKGGNNPEQSLVTDETGSFRFTLNVFNVLNQVNHTGYIGNLSSPFFGQPVAARPARRMQLALKFEF